jgi:exonuclease III
MCTFYCLSILALFLIKLTMYPPVPPVSISSINCNSLNMSSLGMDNHLLKIHGIVSLNSDIIFLSDIRLCNNTGTSNLNLINNSFRCNPYCAYRLIANSKMSRRGVGILIKNSIPYSVLREYRDESDNILGLYVDIDSKQIGLCAIYGPNKTDENFFINLEECIRTLNCPNLVIAGDWNCTVSCLNDDSNIDILNMRQPPNIRHSHLLKKLCEDFDLMDPYRAKYPLKQEFTYQPSDPTKKNRSRLDFFVVSNHLVENINKCYISATVQNKMFDHRAVCICMKTKPKQIRIPTISRDLLKDPDIDLVVKLSISDTYLIHTSILTDPERQRLLLLVGSSKKLLRDAGPDSEILLAGERSEFEELRRSGIIAEIKANLDLIPLDRLILGGFSDNLEDDIFMETLVNNLKNDCVSYQTFISRTIKNTISQSLRQLKSLKGDHRANQDAIFDLEKKIKSHSGSENAIQTRGVKKF